MTREEKINSIIAEIQNNDQLLKLLKLVIATNLSNIEDLRLDIIMQNLGISNG